MGTSSFEFVCDKLFAGNCFTNSNKDLNPPVFWCLWIKNKNNHLSVGYKLLGYLKC